MPRRTKIVTIQAEGRDQGKSFFLTELPAAQAEKWAMRALLALAHAGVELPDNVVGAGWQALAAAGIQALTRLAWDEVEPLMDEMFTCVRVLPDLMKHPDMVRPLFEGDIEEVATRIELRAEIWNLHAGFSSAGAPST